MKWLILAENWRIKPIRDKKFRTRVNADIKATEVRLIDKEGAQVGVVKLVEALSAAKAAGMDLVEISPNSEPPVCRIMDYDKFRFEQKKKQQASKKRSIAAKLKEIKFRTGTEEGDYQVKLRNLLGFLEEGHKVKITVKFRGREIAYQQFGMELLQRLQHDVEKQAVVEQFPKMEGKQLLMLLAPKGKKH